MPKSVPRVDLLSAANLIREHLTEALCEEVWRGIRTTERQRVWSLFELSRLMTEVTLDPPPSLSQALSEASGGRYHAPASSDQALFARCKNLDWRFFLRLFESAAWVGLIAAIIPWVDIYSVFWGPTSKILKHPKGISSLSFGFPIPGESGLASLGVSDLLFFALFLGAAARFRLRIVPTFVLMTLSFGITAALAVWTDHALPALPLLSVGFLLANGDLLWRQLRRPPSAGKRIDRSFQTDAPETRAS